MEEEDQIRLARGQCELEVWVFRVLKLVGGATGIAEFKPLALCHDKAFVELVFRVRPVLSVHVAKL